MDALQPCLILRFICCPHLGIERKGTLHHLALKDSSAPPPPLDSKHGVSRDEDQLHFFEDVMKVRVLVEHSAVKDGVDVKLQSHGISWYILDKYWYITGLFGILGNSYSDRDKSWPICCMISQGKSIKTYPGHCIWCIYQRAGIIILIYVFRYFQTKKNVTI